MSCHPTICASAAPPSVGQERPEHMPAAKIGPISLDAQRRRLHALVSTPSLVVYSNYVYFRLIKRSSSILLLFSWPLDVPSTSLNARCSRRNALTVSVRSR